MRKRTSETTVCNHSEVNDALPHRSSRRRERYAGRVRAHVSSPQLSVRAVFVALSPRSLQLGLGSILLLVALVALAPAFGIGGGGYGWFSRFSLHAQVILPVGGTVDHPADDRLREIFQVRAMALIVADPDLVHPYYDTSSASGKQALDREIRRIEYLKAWAERRGLRPILTETNLTITRLDVVGTKVRASVIVSLGIGYVYPDDPEGTIQWFGIGTRQQVELVRRGADWVISRDDYTDPLDEDTLIPHVEPAVGPFALSASSSKQPLIDASGGGEWTGGYDREGAVRFANRYCGAAWGCGEGGLYHAGYRDYNGIGGDCTNFVSQALGDPEGGKLAQDGRWYHRSGPNGGGSVAWVQTEALIQYLVNTKKATVLARGDYYDVVEPDDEFPYGRIGALRPGDIIGYQEGRYIEHLALVVDTDSHGYVLVNSHSADRYHVPWDLGWDKSVVYWLVTMHDDV